MTTIDKHKINQFASLFKGRNDVYAVRWEKNGYSGYMPAYEVDWSYFKEHKAKGGTFKDYPYKEEQSLITGQKLLRPLIE